MEFSQYWIYYFVFAFSIVTYQNASSDIKNAYITLMDYSMLTW